MRQRNSDLWKIWAVSLLGSVILAGLFFASGKADDCRPDQIDGQCGLSTFLGFVYGVGLAIALQIITVISLVVVAIMRSKKNKASNLKTAGQ